MPNIYFDNLDYKISPVCELFDNICTDNNLNYIIESDNSQEQTYVVSLTEEILNFLQIEAAKTGVLVEYKQGKLTIKLHALAESQRQFFTVSTFDPEAINKMENCAIEHLGEQLRGPFSSLFRGMSLPVKIANVQSVWQTHMTDDKWAGIAQGAYVDKPCDWPLVMDTTVSMSECKEDSEVKGKLIDGHKRLYSAHKHNVGLIEYVDVKDVIIEAEKHLVEDQYRWSSRRQIQNQSSYPQSIGPSKSFGGISGYKTSRKRYVREYEQNTYGKLTGELVAHDQSTVIPAGSMIRIVDHDSGLPDIEFNGRIINVDDKALSKVFKPTSFNDQLESALSFKDNISCIINDGETAFEQQINETFGTMSIVNPDILMTINKNLDDKVIEEVLKKEGDEWVLVSRKSGKVLRRFGKDKPSDDTINKAERQIQYFKHKKN